MAIFIDLKVAANGNYLPHGRSGQKWQFLLTSKLPQMATTCFMTDVAKNGNKWLHVIAKNGNKRNDLQLYRELKSLFCHFWQYFAFSSVIILSKNCQTWKFLLTSKLPKMANEHTWFIVTGLYFRCLHISVLSFPPFSCSLFHSHFFYSLFSHLSLSLESLLGKETSWKKNNMVSS